MKTTSPTTWINRFVRAWQWTHLDGPLLLVMAIICGIGLTVLYSASLGADHSVLKPQIIRIIIATVTLAVFAKTPPERYKHWAPYLYTFTIFLLIVVIFTGHIGKGAQRWIALGPLNFQPSELMKFALPLMLAWYFADRPLPPRSTSLVKPGIIILIPFLIIAEQPDLGTAILILISGLTVLFLAGISWRLITTGTITLMVSVPIMWHLLHDYQKQRILTFLNPERDPLGSGYHIIQSKIAIGSGGLLGKGFLSGTQSHYAFLPEHTTDFIFAVLGEEFGFTGVLVLILLYLLLIARCLVISFHAQDTFTRLLSGSLGFLFFISVFVNICMVSGLMPVVGVPLPLISFGGTSMVTMFATLGIIMSVQTHKKLLNS